MKTLQYMFLVFLISCASGHRNTSKKIRSLVISNNHEAAIQHLSTSPMAYDTKSELLFHLELGLLEHYRENYEKSAESLEKAKKLNNELFTIRASGKIASALSNDNADFYYGEKYEASLIHFYLSLNYFMIGDLQKARAEILEWDSFITELKNDRLGEVIFKEDLLAKIFGALVHESQGNNKDDQIALQLYKDAQEVFYKNYNLFPSFNSYYSAFRQNYQQLPTLSPEEIEGKYVLQTEHSSSFKNFLTLKILLLTKKVRPQELKSQISKLKPNKEILEAVNRSGGNITFLIQDGLIVEKVPQRFEYPLDLGAHTSAAAVFSVGNVISFELPTVDAPPKLELGRLEALDKDGNVVAQGPLSLIAPISEMAEQAINEHSAAIATKTGARVAAKHIAALVAASASYSAARNQNNSMGMMLASLGYAAAVSAIKESEKADVRYWSTLPSNIRMGHLSLPEGSYRFRAIFGSEGSPSYRVQDLGEKVVTKKRIQFVMNNKGQKHQSNTLLAKEEKSIMVEPEVQTNNPTIEQVIATTPKPPSNSGEGCSEDSDCPDGKVCATVKGEFPGSCASTGFFGRTLSSTNASGCMQDSECPDGKVCATVKGVYPGSCASR